MTTMKKLFILSLSLLVLSMTFTACTVEDDYNNGLEPQGYEENTPDSIIFPLVISLKVVNYEGQSVLNNWNTPQISATFRGKTYFCDKPSRGIEPKFWGLKHSNDYLLFGELDGTETYSDEELIINWGNNEKPDTITFSYTYARKSNSLTIYDSYYLNGKAVENGQSLVVKKVLDTDRTIDKSNYEPLPIPLSDSQREEIKLINDFGLNLFRELLAENGPDKSFIFSPLSLAYVLGMLIDGARPGSMTQMQIAKVLHATDATSYYNPSAYKDIFKILIENMPLTDPKVDLGIANALFVDKTITLYGGYADLMAQYYHADYGICNFSDRATIDVVNDWCYMKTKGMIPSIIDEIPNGVISYFLNAVYFKAGWLIPFEKKYTNTAPFYKPDGTTADVPLMRDCNPRMCVRNDEVAATILPFEKGAFEMVFILPENEKTIEDIAPSLTNHQVNSLNWDYYKDATIYLPRFKVDSSHDKLPQQLSALGMPLCFSEQAEFSEISPNASFFIREIGQKAKISVDEQGCEAAAVSYSGVGATSYEPFDFRADHPFIYLIRECSSGAILFIGTYCGD